MAHRPSIARFARLLPLALAAALVVAGAVVDVFGQSPSPEPVIEWQVSSDRARITSVDGVIRAEGGPRSWVRSRQGVNDLVLRLEFRVMTPETRGALLVRAWTDRTGRFARTGYRVAIRGQSSSRETLGQVTGLSQPIQQTVEPVDVAPPAPGEWQRLEVRCVGDTIEVRINDRLVQVATGAEPNAGLLGIEIDEGVLETRSVWLTPVVTEFPHGITSVTQLPDDAVRPRVRRQVKPRYTMDAMDRRVEGTVELEGVIGVDGRVDPVRIVRSLIPDLDAEAIAAVRQWRFHPATVDGKPTPAVATFAISFAMHE